ncbi:MAG: EAL domain-containing protein [Alphaproteobacteria bacterium]|nr:MAG: EAL domain-containing protein [Alphaproteobacteria bacterium]
MAPTSPERTPLAWLPRALVLLAIWGAAVFLWGTFGAWTRNQYLEHETALARANTRAYATWLQDLTKPLERLARDGRLAEGMDLPAGVTSLPVQRVLYEYAYITGQSEVYIADLGKSRMGRTAGAPNLPPEVMTRLASLPDVERMVLAFGQRNGQVLLIHKVKAPLPHRLVVMTPTSLPTLTATAPTPRLTPERELVVLFPHTSGWSQWNVGSNGFALDDDLNQMLDNGENYRIKDSRLLVVTNLPGWPETLLGVQSPNKVVSTRMLPQLLVTLWAVLMSIIVLWKDLAVYRQRVAVISAPILTPLQRIGAPMSVAVGTIAGRMQNSFKNLLADPPLVGGPGEFETRDFVSTDEFAQRINNGVRRPKGKGAVKLGGTPTKGLPDALERRKQPRGNGNARPEAPKMKWPEAEQKPASETATEADADAIDLDDLEAVVRDSLKKKRITLLYQPIYSTHSLMPVMHEVYARLLDPLGKVIGPDKFLPIANKLRLTLDLDVVVLRRVVHEHFANGGAPATPLALNISSTSLDGIAYLQEMAGQGPRVLQKLGFEVSSQEMIRDPKALKLLKDLQRHGGNLAVDYFGGGIAMLDASKALGFNYVKLNCMKLMASDSGKKELILLCQHAQKISLPVILEMVGNDETLAFARRTGAEYLQGYALLHPQDRLTTTPLPPLW